MKILQVSMEILPATKNWKEVWSHLRTISKRREHTKTELRTLLLYLDDFDPLIAYAAAQMVITISKAQYINCIIPLLLECTQGNVFTLQVLRQLTKRKKDTKSAINQGDDESSRDDGDEVESQHHSYLRDLLMEENRQVLCGHLINQIGDGSENSTTHEAIRLASNLAKCSVDMIDAEEWIASRVHSLLVSICTAFALLPFDSLSTYIGTDVMDLFVQWHVLAQSLNSIHGHDDALLVWLDNAVEIICVKHTSISTVALSMLDTSCTSNACADSFISSHNRYPFLQKWMTIMSVLMLTIVQSGRHLDHLSRVPSSTLIQILPSREQVMSVLVEQDDVMIDVLNRLLLFHHLHLSCGHLHPVWIEYVANHLNPHAFFSDLLQTLGEDHTVLIDMLVSCETVAIEYMLQYLRLAVTTWPQCCQWWKIRVNTIMSVLIRLRLEIERLLAADMFPYNPLPLLRQLQKLEDAYESQ